MVRLLSFLFLLIFSQIPPLVAAERTLACRVVGISDGDTLSCLHNRTPLKVRLVHIDAPELAQPYGNKAKQALASFLFKNTVTLKTSSYDQYGRMLAEVYVGVQNINLKMVEQGWAWAYTYSQPIYQQAQQQAQKQRLGLWQAKNPVAPSDWRKIKEVSSHNNALAVKNTQNSANCQQKRSCASFTNFVTANQYFRQCNAQYMDGNGDGIPCNRLYRAMKKQQ